MALINNYSRGQWWTGYFLYRIGLLVDIPRNHFMNKNNTSWPTIYYPRSLFTWPQYKGRQSIHDITVKAHMMLQSKCKLCISTNCFQMTLYSTLKPCLHFVRKRSIQRLNHHNDVTMSTMASQITGVLIVCTTVCSGLDQRKCQSCASLGLWGESTGHRWIPLTKDQ